MKSWNWAVIVFVGWLCAGCASGGNTELMERELRLQEDRIFQLEYEIEERDEALQACETELQALRKSSSGSATGKSDAAESRSKPMRTLPRETDADPGPELLKPPKVDLPPGLKPGEGAEAPSSTTRQPATSRSSDRRFGSILVEDPERPIDVPGSEIRVVGGVATKVPSPIPAPPRELEPAPAEPIPAPPVAQKRRPAWSPNRK